MAAFSTPTNQDLAPPPTVTTLSPWQSYSSCSTACSAWSHWYSWCWANSTQSKSLYFWLQFRWVEISEVHPQVGYQLGWNQWGTSPSGLPVWLKSVRYIPKGLPAGFKSVRYIPQVGYQLGLNQWGTFPKWVTSWVEISELHQWGTANTEM